MDSRCAVRCADCTYKNTPSEMGDLPRALQPSSLRPHRPNKIAQGLELPHLSVLCLNQQLAELERYGKGKARLDHLFGDSKLQVAVGLEDKGVLVLFRGHLEVRAGVRGRTPGLCDGTCLGVGRGNGAERQLVLWYMCTILLRVTEHGKQGLTPRWAAGAMWS